MDSHVPYVHGMVYLLTHFRSFYIGWPGWYRPPNCILVCAICKKKIVASDWLSDWDTCAFCWRLGSTLLRYKIAVHRAKKRHPVNGPLLDNLYRALVDRMKRGRGCADLSNRIYALLL